MENNENNEKILTPNIDLDEEGVDNMNFEHLDDSVHVSEDTKKVYGDRPVVTEAEVEEQNKANSTLKIDDSEEYRKFKLNKKSVVGIIVAGALVVGTIAGISSCVSCNSNAKEKDDEDENNITTEDTTENEVTTTLEEVVVTTEPEQTTIDENEDLKAFASIDYITKDELVELFKAAEKELDGTSVTTEELVAFVVEINKSVINKVE